MRLDSTVRRTPLRTLAVMLVAILAISGLSALAPASAARAADLPSSIMDGGFIISDAEFFDKDAMTAKQAQAFLEKRVPTCKATDGPTCLRSFTANLPAKAKDAYCAAISAKNKVKASEVIVTVAKACGINPQVILVMLQKEQGLVTSTKPSEWSYRAAMGMNCPDTAPCSATSAGFVNQVYLGARQQQVYAKNPTRYNYKAGQVNTIQWSPTASCGTSKVFIENQATANLYIYTPYRPNVAALAAGYASGDACSAYGNRNFYNYYVQWFAPGASPSTGAPAQVAACTAPASADVVAASGTYSVVASNAVAKTAPTGVCTASTKLAKGTKVTVTGRYGAWSRVTVAGAKRWILSTSINLPAPGCSVPAASEVKAASGRVTVNSDSLNARKAPTTACSSGAIQLDRDDSPTRTGIYGAWWRITHNGATYWIHSDYASIEAPADTPPAAKAMYTSRAVQFRTAPGGNGIVATLPTGTAVTVRATSGAWAQAEVGSDSGWLESDRLVAAKPAAVKTSTMRTTAKTWIRPA
ncbi:SH3 domain-containing protein, partial [Microbacterium sp. 179-B 1A2 NHS]|uniref:SH3 domain-containing protein n=1 Tax=Microbacterium sp. 179-B 1A2 NHS TaxID=3142383 RepID=UPI00399F0CC4